MAASVGRPAPPVNARPPAADRTRTRCVQEGRTAEMDPRSGAPGGRRRLGEVLVAGQVLSEAQLEEALRTQREDNGRRRRLGEVITALGFAVEVQIARALSDQL